MTCPRCGQKMLDATLDGRTRVLACSAGHTLDPAAETQEAAPAPKRHKYGVAPTDERTVDGVTFDSKREAAAWLELQARERAGEIVGLVRQVRFPLIMNGKTLESYAADFVFYEVATRRWIVQDAKGFRTRDYKRRRRWMREQFGIEIVET